MKEENLASASTNNSIKYHFQDFTHANYKNILQIAKSKYKFIFFHENEINDDYVLWRHDVDCYPNAALKMAQLEHEENIKATYFILFHSEYYNLMDIDVVNCFKKISELGHEIGLHFDCSFYGIKSEDELEKYLKIEQDLINLIFDFKVKVFSFHNPFSFELNCKKSEYSSLINTYSRHFHTEIGYCSDSNGYWRYDRLEDVLISKKYKSLQVLTHPEQWQEKVMSPKERVYYCLDRNNDNQKKRYSDFLIKHNRENVDW